MSSKRILVLCCVFLFSKNKRKIWNEKMKNVSLYEVKNSVVLIFQFLEREKGGEQEWDNEKEWNRNRERCLQISDF